MGQTYYTRTTRNHKRMGICFLLCGDGDGTLFPLYWGQDNIGIVSLNTFEVSQIGINRYDDNGRPIEEPSGGISTHINSHGEVDLCHHYLDTK